MALKNAGDVLKSVKIKTVSIDSTVPSVKSFNNINKDKKEVETPRRTALKFKTSGVVVVTWSKKLKKFNQDLYYQVCFRGEDNAFVTLPAVKEVGEKLDQLIVEVEAKHQNTEENHPFIVSLSCSYVTTYLDEEKIRSVLWIEDVEAIECCEEVAS